MWRIGILRKRNHNRDTPFWTCFPFMDFGVGNLSGLNTIAWFFGGFLYLPYSEGS
jgi:hypothetical protein